MSRWKRGESKKGDTEAEEKKIRSFKQHKESFSGSHAVFCRNKEGILRSIILILHAV